MKLKIQEKFWIGTFISLWLLVSSVSTVHSVEFFKLSNNILLAWVLALGFEIGAIASLGGLLISRGNKTLIWVGFIILTCFQIHGNMYWAWVQSGDLSNWIHLLDLVDEDTDTQKRIFAVISGGILPIISLIFMKSLMDYLDPAKLKDVQENEELIIEEPSKIDETLDKHIQEDVNVTTEHDKEPTQNDSQSHDDNSVGPLSPEEQSKMAELSAISIDDTDTDNEIIEDMVTQDTPFWSSLDPIKTLNILKKSNTKIENVTK